MSATRKRWARLSALRGGVCAVHSIVIRRLLFKPDEARREDNSKSDSKAAARQEKGRGAGKQAGEIDHMGHARSGKEREVENSAPLSGLS